MNKSYLIKAVRLGSSCKRLGSGRQAVGPLSQFAPLSLAAWLANIRRKSYSKLLSVLLKLPLEVACSSC